ncbi:unnamed protein product, partial [Larinioides sclopetarius]
TISIKPKKVSLNLTLFQFPFIVFLDVIIFLVFCWVLASMSDVCYYFIILSREFVQFYVEKFQHST